MYLYDFDFVSSNIIFNYFHHVLVRAGNTINPFENNPVHPSGDGGDGGDGDGTQLKCKLRPALDQVISTDKRSCGEM
ncbi:unnamed protein product [Leptidea sinapis]|uniref:Uncharacterized protein n=1 Tax=Leptidea sinapis TaxID=189913 RepID=A0A5E4PM62_9NEOP|nr:unnamed protein product [Leptidea sinapis]